MTPSQIAQWKQLRKRSQELGDAVLKLKEAATLVEDGPVQFYLHGLENMHGMIGMRIDAVAQDERWR